MTKQCVLDFHVNKIFVGTDGFDRKTGFTGLDLMRADTVKSMAAQAKHIYILTESEKFLKTGSTAFLKTEEVYQVITDDGIYQTMKEHLIKHGVKLATV